MTRIIQESPVRLSAENNDWPTLKKSNLNLLIFAPSEGTVSETFIRAHVDKLPFNVLPRYGSELAIVDSHGRKIWIWGWWFGAMARRMAPKLNAWAMERFIARHLHVSKADAVLAEYGTTGSYLAPACARAGVPLFVHFHGFDASVFDILDTHRVAYHQMFDVASGVIAVSKAMKEKLIQLGVPSDKLHLNSCGVDPSRFSGGTPEYQPPRFCAVGRFVEKKAPCLTVLAFSHVVKEVPNATLEFVGDGPLLGSTKQLARALGIEKSIIFHGKQDSGHVCGLMQQSRAFVQHSVIAEDGDSEGTPVAVIEAQMTGLPVVATRHAGIPDVVVDGKTGFLVHEGDAYTMGQCMLQLAKNPRLAGIFGSSARERAIAHFTLDRHLSQLAETIELGVTRANRPQ